MLAVVVSQDSSVPFSLMQTAQLLPYVQVSGSDPIIPCGEEKRGQLLQINTPFVKVKSSGGPGVSFPLLSLAMSEIQFSAAKKQGTNTQNRDRDMCDA